MKIIRANEQTGKYFKLNISFDTFSLGSIRLQDMRNISPNTWWYEFTFLFIEITWGQIPLK